MGRRKVPRIVVVDQKLLQRLRINSYKDLENNRYSICLHSSFDFFCLVISNDLPYLLYTSYNGGGHESQTFSPKYKIHFHLWPSTIGCTVCVTGRGLNEDESHKKKRSADASALTSSRATLREGNIALVPIPRNEC